jgi:hypothetical protein
MSKNSVQSNKQNKMSDEERDFMDEIDIEQIRKESFLDFIKTVRVSEVLTLIRFTYFENVSNDALKTFLFVPYRNNPELLINVLESKNENNLLSYIEENKTPNIQYISLKNKDIDAILSLFFMCEKPEIASNLLTRFFCVPADSKEIFQTNINDYTRMIKENYFDMILNFVCYESE